MKKYFNKGLLYQWFNSSKAFIFLGVILWGFIANQIMNSNIYQIKGHIAYNFNNHFTSINLPEYVFLGLIFIGIHFVGQGINKRNTAMFLTSAPYTKKQIKYNEIICLLITLALFVLTFLYIAGMAYIRYAELMSIIDGYGKIITIEVIRIVLIGIAGILFMNIIDSMFASSIVGLISMITIIPASILMLLGKIYMILEYIPIMNGQNIFDIYYLSRRYPYAPNPIFDTIDSNMVTKASLLKASLFMAAVIIVLFIIFNLMQKLNTLEFSTKIFTSKANENIITILCSLGAGSFASLLITQSYITSMRGSYYRDGSAVLYGMQLFKALALDAVVISVISFVVYKIIRRILKTVS